MEQRKIRRIIAGAFSVLTAAIMLLGSLSTAQAQAKKPNIVIIWEQSETSRPESKLETDPWGWNQLFLVGKV